MGTGGFAPCRPMAQMKPSELPATVIVSKAPRALFRTLSGGSGRVGVQGHGRSWSWAMAGAGLDQLSSNTTR
ncbi:hypothetical protein E5D57_008644 [Metarhizium anisopliae]|nr:hypothetical protein E5D57_008644 [Metarhizium anisopliae]